MDQSETLRTVPKMDYGGLYGRGSVWTQTDKRYRGWITVNFGTVTVQECERYDEGHWNRTKPHTFPLERVQRVMWDS